MPCYSISPVARRSVHYNPFFGPQFVAPVARFSAPFFRSLEDELTQFDNFFREVDQQVAKVKAQTQSFQPRFDIKEESDKFVLHGELPGVQSQHLSVEFIDRNTMQVKGKVVRQETHGTPPAAPAEQESVEDKSQEDVTMSGAAPDTVSETGSTTNYHKASVEDEEFENVSASEVDTPAESAIGSDNNTVAEKPPQQEVTPEKAPEQPQPHYWVSERIVGEFSRAFRFPGQVNQDGVSASLKDGILTVDVPKVQQQDHRRKIQVQGL